MHLKESVLRILVAFLNKVRKTAKKWVNVGYFNAFERVSTADSTCSLYQTGCVGKCRLF